MNVKKDHRSKFSNLSCWKDEAWKKSGLQLQQLYQLSYEATHWEQGQLIEFISSCEPRSEMMWRGERGESEEWSSQWILNFFFRLLLSNRLSWKIHCDDHSSLSSITAVQIWIISHILQIEVLVITFCLSCVLLFLIFVFHQSCDQN